MTNGLKKGAQFEREVCKWLDDNLNVQTKRLLGQAREGGADIETDHFLIEVKRRETLDLYSWWTQVIRAKAEHENSDLIPIVVFKQNRKPMQWLIPADLLPNVDKGYMIVNSNVFQRFAKGVMHGIGRN